MNVPNDRYLVSQSFNSKKLEFVWQFPRKLDSSIKDQFIFQVELNPVIYIQWGTVNAAGDYVDSPGDFKFGYGHLDPAPFLTSELNWAPKKFPEVYGKFSNGIDLIPLIRDVVEYLKSI